MLQVQHICKQYTTGKLVQKALDDVSLNFRNNEFVAILGPSGSGKTTLLNMIGGLDHYDSGDLIINGISTKKYKDRDWDSYRNHTVGFVFQSYNLIPHQTIQSNVELALTISGVGKGERRKRAREALAKVGLAGQEDKRPNQLSGGQMQRVAIARALVNDPDILLADEPTGALDSDTSVQVMDLLREVAKDRLVIMVTHNPELAQQYATRTIELRDGKIQSDTDPFFPDVEALEPPAHKNMGKAAMSFLTALALSFNNLRTKKARTFLTAFAGSIGIIGIALILSISNGINNYIDSEEQDMLYLYPLEIRKAGLDISSLMTPEIMGMGGASTSGNSKDGKVDVTKSVTAIFSSTQSNDVKEVKKYLESGKSGIDSHVRAIEYTYNVTPQIYSQNADSIRQVNPDTSFDNMGLSSRSSMGGMISAMMNTEVFYAMPKEEKLYTERYDVKAGRWPENRNECVLVLSIEGKISDQLAYTLGLRDYAELDDMIGEFTAGKDVSVPEDFGTYSYDKILGKTFKVINKSDCYEYDEQYQLWKDKTDDEAYMKQLVAEGEDLKIVGIVQSLSENAGGVLSNGINYPESLTQHVIEQAKNSVIVKDQMNRPDTNVFTNESFGAKDSEGGFDLTSLFQMDPDALQSMFSFDASALEKEFGRAFDLSGTLGQMGTTDDFSKLLSADAGQMTWKLPAMPQLELKDLMGNIQFHASQDQMQQISVKLLKGYQDYAKEHPQADYSGLGTDFMNYLNTDDARQIISDNIREIIKQSGDVQLTTEQIRELLTDILKDFKAFADENGYENLDQFDEAMQAYLETERAQAIVRAWANKNLHLDETIKITKSQMKMLAGDLAAGYQKYAQANSLPDPSQMGTYFVDYLNTPTAREILTDGLTQMVDTSALEQQFSTMMGSYMQSAAESISSEVQKQVSNMIQAMVSQVSKNMQSAMTKAAGQLQDGMKDAFQMNPEKFQDMFQNGLDEKSLTELFASMFGGSTTSYSNNLEELGYADLDDPQSINLYPYDFDAKDQITSTLDHYNDTLKAKQQDEKVITYTDTVGTMLSSVTKIINIVSYALIGFVGISLVVSSIMIGVITYISVLERKKEIGILRALGASKGNVSQVFNAETGLIGLCSGILGVGIACVLLIPGNVILHKVSGISNIYAVMTVADALILVGISVLLTLIGGLIPSRRAAKNDPVESLRTE